MIAQRRLEGRVALVTGGGRGIGRAVCEALAGDGARVAVLARTLDEVTAVADALRADGSEGEALPLAADVADYASVADAVGAVLTGWGRLDVVVNAAGIITPIAQAWEVDPAAWQRNVAINLIGAFNVCHAALPHLLRQGGGCLINVSSGAAHNPVTGWSAYCAAKAGLDHFTRVLAAEVQDTGVRVNAVYPGVVDTRMQEEIRRAGEEQFGPENVARFRGYHESGALRRPEEPAALIAWAAATPDLHGEFLSVDDPDTMRRAGLSLGTRRG